MYCFAIKRRKRKTFIIKKIGIVLTNRKPYLRKALTNYNPISYEPFRIKQLFLYNTYIIENTGRLNNLLSIDILTLNLLMDKVNLKIQRKLFYRKKVDLMKMPYNYIMMSRTLNNLNNQLNDYALIYKLYLYLIDFSILIHKNNPLLFTTFNNNNLHKRFLITRQRSFKYQRFYNTYQQVKNDSVYNNELKRYTELYRDFIRNRIKTLSYNLNIYNLNLSSKQYDTVFLKYKYLKY